jgi:prophage antirepressor-like protein
MNELQIFNSKQFGKIRAVEINNEPWFCLADVCKPLGLQAKHCRERLKSGGVVLTDLTDSSGRKNQMLVISEGNLYRAIFQSKKPEAEQFTDWVTEEVLPALRKNGSYALPEKTHEVSLNGLANLIRITRKTMIDMGSSPLDIGEMVKSLYDTCNIPVPPPLLKQLPGQMVLTDVNVSVLGA